MTDENNDAQSESPEQSAESQTLDDLYSEFQTQETQTSQSAPQQQETTVQQSFNNVPDPVTNTEQFTEFMQQNQNEIAALKNNLTTTMNQLDAEKQQMATKREEEAFTNFSGEIAKEAGLDSSDVEPHLLYKFIKDDKFQHIWTNKDSNPKALAKVKSILAQEMKGKASKSVDPQVQSDQRAMDDAIKSASNGTMKTSKDDDLSKMNSAQFDREWQRMLGG